MVGTHRQEGPTISGAPMRWRAASQTKGAPAGIMAARRAVPGARSGPGLAGGPSKARITGLTTGDSGDAAYDQGSLRLAAFAMTAHTKYRLPG